MSSPTHFQVDPDQIRAHANTVKGVASGLSATAGGLQGRLADNALGSFVQFVTAGLGSVMTQAAEAIAKASTAMDAVSSGLVGTADDYQRADEDNAALLLRKEAR
jgi:uncharacterized protein (DUF697 family)